MRKVVLTLLLGLLIVGCKHPLKIIGKGDIESSTGTRDCLYADYISDPTICTENSVTYPEDYIVSYEAKPHEGWYFHRWDHWCQQDAMNPVCGWNIPASVVQKAGDTVLKPQTAIFREINISGYKSLFMGHSLFDGFALRMDNQASHAGFVNHSQTALFFPGELGSPISAWNSPLRKAAIQAILAEGDVDLFGMAMHHDNVDIEGYRLWIDYTLTQNPDSRFFIGVPHLWYIQSQFEDAAAYEAAWQTYLTDSIYPIVDQLRVEFPSADIYVVPYGEAAVELYKLFETGALAADGINDLVAEGWFPGDPEPVDSYVMLDDRGHPDDITLALGELIWLASIYGVDLTNYTYDHGYQADLISIAADIMAAQDPTYNAPYLTPPPPPQP